MLWDGFLAQREARRSRVLDATRDLLDDRPATACALLQGWTFHAQHARVARLFDHCLRSRVQPSPGQVAAAIDPPVDLPRPPAWSLEASERIHRRWLALHCSREREPSDLERLAWMLDELGFFGDEVERLHREEWRNHVYPPPPQARRSDGPPLGQPLP